MFALHHLKETQQLLSRAEVRHQREGLFQALTNLRGGIFGNPGIMVLGFSGGLKFLQGAEVMRQKAGRTKPDGRFQFAQSHVRLLALMCQQSQSFLRKRAGRCELLRLGESSFGRIQSVDRKSTRLNSSHLGISYAVFCLKKNEDATLLRNPQVCDRVRPWTGRDSGGSPESAFFFNDTAPTEIYTLSLHDALPI